MLILSYWGREKKVEYKEGNDVYDRPTPLDFPKLLPQIAISDMLKTLGEMPIKNIRSKKDENRNDVSLECR